VAVSGATKLGVCAGAGAAGLGAGFAGAGRAGAGFRGGAGGAGSGAGSVGAGRGSGSCAAAGEAEATKRAATSASQSILVEDRSGRRWCLTGRDESRTSVTNPSSLSYGSRNLALNRPVKPNPLVAAESL
jgi:hypothetical protein